MPEGCANHREYIHSPSIVQIPRSSNALGAITRQQVLCQYWALFKKAKKSTKYQILKYYAAYRDSGKICQVAVCSLAQSLWAKVLNLWFKKVGRLSPKADGAVICRHTFSPGWNDIVNLLCRKYGLIAETVTRFPKWNHYRSFFVFCFLNIFENVQVRKTCAATNYVRKTTFYFVCCRSFETLPCHKSVSYTDSSEL